LAAIIETHGGNGSMKEAKALVFKQKSLKLYYFTMDARELEPLCYVVPATRDQQKGLQRVTEESRLREIGEFLKDDESSLLPNNIILNLTSSVQINEKRDGTATIIFPKAQGDYAFVVDGQHRLFSFRDEYRKLSDDETFDLPVVALHDAPEELVGAAFVAINVNQKPVNRDLLTQMKAILGLLDTDIDKACVDLIHAIDADPSSPLNDKILRYPKEKNKWVKTNQLLPVIKGLLLPGACLHDKNPAERKRILVEYLKAVAETFPDAWADEKKTHYALLLPTGLQIMLSLLPDVMARCDFYENFTYNVQTFKRQLEPLVALALLGNWSKSTVEGSISVKPRRAMFLGQLKEALRVKPPSR
jgi:DGQHR domain-containing protein